jgi:hypothetical protein
LGAILTLTAIHVKASSRCFIAAKSIAIADRSTADAATFYENWPRVKTKSSQLDSWS